MGYWHQTSIRYNEQLVRIREDTPVSLVKPGITPKQHNNIIALNKKKSKKQ